MKIVVQASFLRNKTIFKQIFTFLYSPIVSDLPTSGTQNMHPVNMVKHSIRLSVSQGKSIGYTSKPTLRQHEHNDR